MVSWCRDAGILVAQAPLYDNPVQGLPGLLNVIGGEMNIIGPYPMFESFVTYRVIDDSEVRNKIRTVLSVEPGIIDIVGEDALTRPSFYKCDSYWLDMYIEYVKNRSFFNDLRLFIRSVILYYSFQIPNAVTSFIYKSNPPPFMDPLIPLPRILSKEEQ